MSSHRAPSPTATWSLSCTSGTTSDGPRSVAACPQLVVSPDRVKIHTVEQVRREIIDRTVDWCDKIHNIEQLRRKIIVRTVDWCDQNHNIEQVLRMIIVRTIDMCDKNHDFEQVPRKIIVKTMDCCVTIYNEE